MAEAGLKRIAVLGSTGSIGTQTLEVVGAFPDRLKVVGLGAASNVGLLVEQATAFRPRMVHARRAEDTRLLGAEHVTLEEMATAPDVDLVVIATGGVAGLLPCLAALRAGKRVALANKETLVVAGAVVMATARAHGGALLPVDSEHSAVWQCLQGEPPASVRQLLLTASGGAFRDYSVDQLRRVTPQDALCHPTWRMGKKVTVDSATLMNKGLEVMEAHWLFGLPYDSIGVVLHRESIVHSMVEFADGSVKAQLGVPDMRVPIQYALSHPERWDNPDLPRLDLVRVAGLSFSSPDLTRFPCLRLALEAARRGGTYPAVLSGADEAAVSLFLAGRVGLLDIAGLVEQALESHRGVAEPSLDDLLAAHCWAFQQVFEWSGGQA